MGRRSHAQRLNIWLNGLPVGCWETAAGRHTLTYFDEWRNDEQTRPLSLSLPFKPGNAAHTGPAVRNFFDNLLPDSDTIRRRMASHFGTDGIEPQQLLAAVGRDCVGAIQLLGSDEAAPEIHAIEGIPLADGDVAALLRNTTAEQALGQGRAEPDLRLSIAGAQEKTALLWHQGQWQLPVGATPTTHILKLPLGLVGAMQADLRTSVENEWLCSRIVRAFGLPTASCSMAQFEDAKALVVERFDRRLAADGSWIVRLPQEDFCQAKGVSPLRKYQADGGPGMAAIMDVLMGSDDAQQDRYRFFKTQLVFWLLAATDGHAKNFSIFHLPGNRFRSTPLYDILSAHPILGRGAGRLAPQKAKLAMAVRASENYYLIGRIHRRHWTAQAIQLGLGAHLAERMIDEVLAQVETIAALVYQDLPDGFPMDVAEAIVEGMRAQAHKLAQMPRG